MNNETKNAYVYKLQCNDGYYYYGSTKSQPRFRLNQHKQDCKKYPERQLYKHINTISWNCVNLEIVEEIPFTSHSELVKKEDEYIKESLKNKDLKCLNLKRSQVEEEEKRKRLEKEEKQLEEKKPVKKEKQLKKENKLFYYKKYLKTNYYIYLGW